MGTPRIDRIDRNLILNGRMSVNQRFPAGGTRGLNTVNGFFYVDRFGGRSVNATGPAETTLNATLLNEGPLDSAASLRLGPASASTRLGYGTRLELFNFAKYPTGTVMYFRCFVRRTVGASAPNAVVRAGYRIPATTHVFPPFSDFIDSQIVQTRSYNGLSDSSWTELSGEIVLTDLMKTNGLYVAVQVIEQGELSTTLMGNTIDVGGFSLTTFVPPDDHVPFAYTDGNLEQFYCQRYYLKSYPLGIAPGTTTDEGVSVYVAASASATATLSHCTRFDFTMRVSPIVTLYSRIGGASGVIRDDDAPADVAATATQISRNGFCVTKTTAHTAGRRYSYHYVADAEM